MNHSYSRHLKITINVWSLWHNSDKYDTKEQNTREGTGNISCAQPVFGLLSRKVLFLLSFVSIWTTDKEEKYVLQTNQRLRRPWQNEGKLCTDCVTWSPRVFSNIRKFSFLLVKVEGGGVVDWMMRCAQICKISPRYFGQYRTILDTRVWFCTVVSDFGH